MNSPRVAHLVYNLIRGGTEGQCARVAMGLTRMGLTHRVAVFHRRGYFLDAVEQTCGAIHEVGIRRLVRPSTLREIWHLSRWIRSTGADILHAWDADSAIFGSLSARLAGVKLVTSRRDLGQIYPRWKMAMIRHADRIAARVVVNAEAIRAKIASEGTPDARIDRLPNMVDLTEFDAQAGLPFPNEDRLPAGRRMGVVNRLDPEKNTVLLLEALPLVRREISDAVLIVAGDGREMAALRERAAALGVDGAVCFLGDTAEIPQLLRLVEAGALVPRRNEGLSNTILEYMAAGLPVLATDCGGNAELVINGETGRLVDQTASSEQVAKAWVDLLRHSDAAGALGRNGRERVEQQFAARPVLQCFADFYQRVMSGE